jgi:tetratricopeptide (TPR) repeat protein
MSEADSARLEGYARRREGDLVGAVPAFATAAEHYRRAGGSDAAVSGLVDVLCDAADVLARLGDAQAVARAGEAVEVLRSRAMLGEGTVPTPQAARALLTLGTAELQAGDPAATRDLGAAVETARRLTTALPTDPNRALLAHALNHQSSAARVAGQLDDAATAAGEAVDLRRELAATDPDRFAGPLGSALNNLAAVQGDQQNLAAAAASAEEACRVLDPLVEAGDLGAAPNLAAAQNNAAAFLGDLGELEMAAAFGTMAVEGYRQLAGRYPAPAFVPELARALVMLATCVVNLDQIEAATDLCYSATALLVEQADLLALPDLAFLADSTQHYLVFAQMSDAKLDEELLEAARSAIAEAGRHA